MGEERGGTYLECPLKGADWQEGEILLFLCIPDEVHVHKLLQLKHTHTNEPNIKNSPLLGHYSGFICFCLFQERNTENFKKQTNKHHPIPALKSSFSILITQKQSDQLVLKGEGSKVGSPYNCVQLSGWREVTSDQGVTATHSIIITTAITSQMEKHHSLHKERHYPSAPLVNHIYIQRPADQGLEHPCAC